MKPYAPERKEAILKKLALPGSLSVTELAQQEGIPRKTLYHWRKQARDQGLLMPNQADSPENWSNEDKFRAVLEATPLSQAELSQYCRERGLYPEQINQWRTACMSGFESPQRQSKAEKKPTTSSATRSNVLSVSSTERRKRWPKRRLCWFYQKSSRRSGRAKTGTNDPTLGSQKNGVRYPRGPHGWCTFKACLRDYRHTRAHLLQLGKRGRGNGRS